MVAPPPIPGLPAFPLFQVPSTNPAIPSIQQIAAQGTNLVNALLAQLSSNPVSFLAAPFILPAALALQLSQKVQGGSLTPTTVNVSTLMSGAMSTVRNPGTNIAQGQLINNGPGAMIVVANPPGGNPSGAAGAIVGPGLPFNFGAIDLGAVYFAGAPGNNAIVSGTLYTES